MNQRSITTCVLIGILLSVQPAFAIDHSAADVLQVESKCMRGSNDPSALPKQVLKDCTAAADVFREIAKNDDPSTQDLAVTNVALFEFYSAHAADAVYKNGAGDKLRANVKTLLKLVSGHKSADQSTRDHANYVLQCFFEGNSSACDKAFNATPTHY